MNDTTTPGQNGTERPTGRARVAQAARNTWNLLSPPGWGMLTGVVFGLAYLVKGMGLAHLGIGILTLAATALVSSEWTSRNAEYITVTCVCGEDLGELGK